MLMDRFTGQNISDIEHTKNCIQDILTTIMGSRIERRGYGCNTINIMDRAVSKTLLMDLKGQIAIAIDENEPRYKIYKITYDVSNLYTKGVVVVNLDGVYLPNNKPLLLSIDLNLVNK
jgi:phage baseplate assembly protein W